MTAEEKELLLATVKDLIDAHWIIAQTLLRVQKHLENTVDLKD